MCCSLSPGLRMSPWPVHEPSLAYVSDACLLCCVLKYKITLLLCGSSAWNLLMFRPISQSDPILKALSQHTHDAPRNGPNSGNFAVYRKSLLHLSSSFLLNPFSPTSVDITYNDLVFVIHSKTAFRLFSLFARPNDSISFACKPLHFAVEVSLVQWQRWIHSFGSPNSLDCLSLPEPFFDLEPSLQDNLG